MIHRVLVGGTASGKKRLAAELHARHGLRLLSMDSMKVYRGMDIGTDKPSPALQARAPFALLDLVGHDESFSVGRWAAAAAAEAARPGGEAAPLLFAGGTPLYLRALLLGLCPAPPADPALRSELADAWDRDGEQALRARLAGGDPECAARLAPGDRKRLLRALEVLVLTGRPLSRWQSEDTRPVLPGSFRVVALRLAAADRQRRIVERVERMLAAGLLDEVAGLRARAPFAPEPARAIGYAEALDVLDGRSPAGGLADRIVLRTRRLQRKQHQFLASLPGVSWLDVAPGAPHDAVLADVERALGV